MNQKLHGKKNLDWGSLGFNYQKTDFRFRAIFRDGKWSKGEIIQPETMNIHEGSPALHYAQQCFEGLKAQESKDGRILLFRPDLNAQRLQETARRLLMPEVPIELFLRGIEETIRHNLAWVPPAGSGASLYLRPLLIGIDENLGLRPAEAYEFRVFACPVGPYYKGTDLSVISLAVTDIDRAAPMGTGHVKSGSNYAGGLLATQKAKELGANEALYLDAAERKYLEEAGSANIVIKMKDNRFITPKSSSILPSVTRKSVMTLAKEKLGLITEERPINFLEEVEEFEEMGACGTAAVISPIGKIWSTNRWFSFYDNGNSVGPIMLKLYQHLTQIQSGAGKDDFGWIRTVHI